MTFGGTAPNVKKMPWKTPAIPLLLTPMGSIAKQNTMMPMPELASPVSRHQPALKGVAGHGLRTLAHSMWNAACLACQSWRATALYNSGGTCRKPPTAIPPIIWRGTDCDPGQEGCQNRSKQRFATAHPVAEYTPKACPDQEASKVEAVARLPVHRTITRWSISATNANSSNRDCCHDVQ